MLQPQACNFIEKETLEQEFFYEFCEIYKNMLFIEDLWWLLQKYLFYGTFFNTFYSNVKINLFPVSSRIKKKKNFSSAVQFVVAFFSISSEAL